MAEGRDYLSKIDDNGVSVYSHITDVLARILAGKPADALDVFESVSLEAKAGHFTPASATAPEASPDAESASAWQTATSTLLAAPSADAEAEEDAELKIPNVTEEMGFFEMAGVGVSREEAHRVFVSMHKLQQGKKLSSVRFFGKVLGTAKDYYVAEGKYVEDPAAEEPEEGAPPPPVPIEERGTGCNTFTYFVTTDVSEPWVELPQVTPAQIAAAMAIRKFVTGDLSADVRAYPPFPGKEKEYLRAQIARIWAETSLAPKGKFALDAEDPGDLPFGVKPSVDDEGNPTAQLAAADLLAVPNWSKQYMGVLGIGRCTNPPKEEEEEEGEEGASKPKGPEPEAEVAALTPAADAQWSAQLYTLLGGGSAVAVARSLVWPGAYSAAVQKEGKFANLYIGYGQASLPAPFAPPPPPPIEAEPDDLAEQVDMPLADENALFRATKEKELAEAADEAEEE